MDPYLGRLYFNKYRLEKKLGEGSFGSVYLAKYDNNYFALKFEHKLKGQSLLKTEAFVMSYLKGRKYVIIIMSFSILTI